MIPPPHDEQPPRSRRYQPVDILSMGYLLVVFGGLVVLGGHVEHCTACMAIHLGLFILIRIAVPHGRRSRLAAVRFVANLYPLAFYVFLYSYANLANTLIFRHHEPFDRFFAGLDQQIFGVQPSFWLAQTFGSTWVHEIVHAFYASYYVQIPIVAIFLYFRSRNRIEFQRFFFTLCLTFYASYIAFIVLPVHGPATLRGDDYGTGLVFVPFLDLIYSLAETGGGAFPSSHVAVALVCLLFCRRHSRWLFRVWLLPVIGLTFATVYCRYHYAVDTIAGVAWGLCLFGLGLLLFSGTVSSTSSACAD